MLLTLMKAKLHRACVTSCDMNYEGSVAIDLALMRSVGLLRHERVDIWNIDTGGRFSTYVIEAPSGCREIAVNGAAARHCHPGDRVIITAFAVFTPEEAECFTPKVVVLDRDNEIRQR